MHTRAESKGKIRICEIGDAGNFLPDSGQRPPCLCGRQPGSAYTFWQGRRRSVSAPLFVRGGNGEFRAVVNCENIEGSGCNMEECCGPTLHETDSAWRAYTTIWEDAVAHAAEVELADVTAEKVRGAGSGEGRGNAETGRECIWGSEQRVCRERKIG